MAYKLSRKKAKEVIRKIRALVKEYFKKNNLTYAVFGKSKGIDSSVVAGLLSDIPGVKPIGVLIPIESDPDDLRIGRLVLDHFSIPALKVDLTPEYRILKKKFYTPKSICDQLLAVSRRYKDPGIKKTIKERERFALGNIKARLRMITLYHVAQLVKGIVISTDTFSEWWMGFWTLCGDIGDLALIQKLFKGLEERVIAEVLGVPRESIDAIPSDGLGVTPKGTAEEQLGFPYPELDWVIVRLLQERFDTPTEMKQDRVSLVAQISKELGLPKRLVEKTASRMRKTGFKRCWPVQFDRKSIGLTGIDQIKL